MAAIVKRPPETPTADLVLQEVWPLNRTGGVLLRAETHVGVVVVIASPAPLDIIDMPQTPEPQVVVAIEGDVTANSFDRAAHDALRQWHERYEWREKP